MIEQEKIPDLQNLPMMRKIIGNIQERAIEFLYTSTLPTVDTVPNGKFVVYDDGAGTKRLYVKTGRGNLGFVNLT